LQNNKLEDTIIKKKKEDKIAFFRTIDFFKHWSHSDISSFVHHIEEKSFKRNYAIFEEGDSPNELYFIRSGQIEVTF
jgi:CRP-like cAMP-binding protein